MEVIRETVSYAGACAYRLGRRVFRNDGGAITLEWIIIAGVLVVAAVAAGAFFSGVIKTDEAKLK